MNSLKEQLEQAWNNGFFYQLRNGRLDEEAFNTLKARFKDISYENLDLSDKRLISLLWFIPIFISWQEERLEKNKVSKEKINEVSGFFFNQCEKILGLP